MKNKRALDDGETAVAFYVSWGLSKYKQKADHTCRVTNVGHLHLVVKGGIAEHQSAHITLSCPFSLPLSFTITSWSFISVGG